MAEVNWTALVIFILLFAFITWLGFAAAKMIRRILGLAHNIDLEWIKDPALRASCETKALRLARDMMVNTERYRTITAVTDAARRLSRA